MSSSSDDEGLEQQVAMPLIAVHPDALADFHKHQAARGRPPRVVHDGRVREPEPEVLDAFDALVLEAIGPFRFEHHWDGVAPIRWADTWAFDFARRIAHSRARTDDTRLHELPGSAGNNPLNRLRLALMDELAVAIAFTPKLVVAEDAKDDVDSTDAQKAAAIGFQLVLDALVSDNQYNLPGAFPGPYKWMAKEVLRRAQDRPSFDGPWAIAFTHVMLGLPCLRLAPYYGVDGRSCQFVPLYYADMRDTRPIVPLEAAHNHYLRAKCIGWDQLEEHANKREDSAKKQREWRERHAWIRRPRALSDEHAALLGLGPRREKRQHGDDAAAQEEADQKKRAKPEADEPPPAGVLLSDL